MKEDYLWDKQGEDAEIMALENALKAFRYHETELPALAPPVAAVEKRSRKFFQISWLRFAVPAFAALVIALSLVWLVNSDKRLPAAASVADMKAPHVETSVPVEETVQPPATASIKAIENSKPSVKPQIVKARAKTAPVVHADRAILRTDEPKQPAETLTAEEKYAYDQLMLALSITGSKLRIVKDKLNGIEDQNAVLETTK